MPTTPSQHGPDELFALAETVQIHLAQATQSNAPNLRYSVILEELQQETRRRLQKMKEKPTSAGADFLYEDIPTLQSASTEWDSMLNFPVDPELWLEIDAFPFSSDMYAM